MKCEMIRDLLPLYIDGLTSEESNKEIEKHLRTCKECRIYYQEMTGEIQSATPISDEEIQDVELIRKIKKRNRRKVAGLLAASILVVVIALSFVFSQTYSRVKFEDVQIDYGVRGDKAYLSIESEPGYELWFSGSVSENESILKILSARKIGGSGKDIMRWEDELGTEDNPCRWTIEFQDKTIVIENGELVEEK